MKRTFLALVAVLTAASLAISGCGQAAPAPTQPPAAPTKAAEPTKAPAAPTKAAEPTKAPAAQPTAAPAKKVDFPQKGKAITWIVPYSAGGPADTHSRLVAAAMEKELGVNIQVANKPTASGQAAWMELADARPDGYTVGYISMPSIIATYLPPERKATFNRNSFQIVGVYTVDPYYISVKGDGPFKTAKDLVDAAKAKPEGVKIGTGGGPLSAADLPILWWEQSAGVKFAHVQFDGGGPVFTAVLGGHVDAGSTTGAGLLAHVNSGNLRVVGVASKEESPLFPGAKTFQSQGYNVLMSSYGGVLAPGATPKEIVDILTDAMERATKTTALKERMDAAGVALRYVKPSEFAPVWADVEAQLRPLMVQGLSK